MSSPTTIGAAVAALTLPALAATGHPWMAGAGLLLGIGVLVLQSWQEARSTLTRHKDVLSYAHTSVSLGVDPTPVVEALRPRREYELDSACHEEDLHIGRWVHLPPSRDYY